MIKAMYWKKYSNGHVCAHPVMFTNMNIKDNLTLPYVAEGSKTNSYFTIVNAIEVLKQPSLAFGTAVERCLSLL